MWQIFLQFPECKNQILATGSKSEGRSWKERMKGGKFERERERWEERKEKKLERKKERGKKRERN